MRWDDLEAVLAQPPVSFFSTGQRWPSWNPWTPRPPWPQGDHPSPALGLRLAVTRKPPLVKAPETPRGLRPHNPLGSWDLG